MSTRKKNETRSQSPAIWVIALTVCGGGALMVLAPIKDRLGEARASLDEAHALDARAGELTAGKPIMEMERAQILGAIETIEHAGGSVAEPSALVSRINALASAAGVVIDRVSPKLLDSAKVESGGIRPDAIVTTTVQATGNFNALTAFLAGLEREELLGGVRSVRMTPLLSQGTSDLRATIEMTHASFTVPSNEELAAMALAGQG